MKHLHSIIWTKITLKIGRRRKKVNYQDTCRSSARIGIVGNDTRKPQRAKIDPESRVVVLAQEFSMDLNQQRKKFKSSQLELGLPLTLRRWFWVSELSSLELDSEETLVRRRQWCWARTASSDTAWTAPSPATSCLSSCQKEAYYLRTLCIPSMLTRIANGTWKVNK